MDQKNSSVFKRFRSRSIERLGSAGPSPKKPHRNHSIEQILHSNHTIEHILRPDPPNFNLPIQFGYGKVNSKPSLENYVRQLEYNVEPNTKFHLVRSTSKFLIENVPADPESLLASIFHHCIERAVENSRQHGFDPDRLGCTISSELLSSDIYIPIRTITEDTVDSILNRFLLVAQSKKQDDVTLWGSPFNVSVTAVDHKGLPSKQIKGGSAYRKKKIGPFHHRINPQCLIKVRSKIV